MMRRRAVKVFCLITICIFATRCPAQGQPMVLQSPEAQTIASATQVLQQFASLKIQSIPQELLNNAQGVVIIPNVLKVGFVIGGRFGRGVVLMRTPEGAWRMPIFVTFTGGSIGWQIGAQSTDVVLVFKNRRGIDSLLSGNKFTLGADAAVAAGPVGRQASTGTDIQFNAEIYSYSRSRGLFAGVSLDGSVLAIDNRATMAYYPGGAVPPQAVQLAQLLANDAAGVTTAGPLVPVQNLAAPNQQESLRRSLVDAVKSLDATVDAQWRNYLTLPASVQSGVGPVNQAELNAVVARYDRIQTDAQYAALAKMPQFKTAYTLLRNYAAATTDVRQAAATLALPPPPK